MTFKFVINIISLFSHCVNLSIWRMTPPKFLKPDPNYLLTETIEWIGIWGKHMKSIMFRAIKDGQKMNHFPGTFQIGRKDRLWRNLQKLVSKYGLSEFGIMPKTYVLPNDIKLLKHDWEKYAANNEKWIIKPVSFG